ncbi:hypothetical protein AKJ09_07003 [Labilithrix luteola]|uniref:Uncharacterized protein n=1 Tax=Labilithrix luteola TaxID=1391654 RepID=A0A0K1Q4M4_9BACT|nr:hypothetical protein [Labilithrix luteola]AKV00340.1 hypothetical protein AKJ09_07003 [Labilithrix luteola]
MSYLRFEITQTQTLRTLETIWGSSSSDVWTAGAEGVVRHWTNDPLKAWTYVAPFTTVDLHALRGSGASDVWVVGDDAAVFHFDGSAWQPAKLALPAGLRPNLYAVWAVAPDDVWAVGNGIILRSRSKVLRGTQ